MNNTKFLYTLAGLITASAAIAAMGMGIADNSIEHMLWGVVLFVTSGVMFNTA